MKRSTIRNASTPFYVRKLFTRFENLMPVPEGIVFGENENINLSATGCHFHFKTLSFDREIN